MRKKTSGLKQKKSANQSPNLPKKEKKSGKKEYLRVFFAPDNKKFQSSSFNIIASSNEEAVEECKKAAPCTLKILGIAPYHGDKAKFENKKFI